MPIPIGDRHLILGENPDCFIKKYYYNFNIDNKMG